MTPTVLLLETLAQEQFFSKMCLITYTKTNLKFLIQLSCFW